MVVPFVLIVAILLAVMLYWKRRQSQRGTPNVPDHTNNTPAASEELTGYHHEVDTAEYATIDEFSDAVPTPAAYDQVAASTTYYENSHPVYENCSGADQRNQHHYEESQRKKESHIYDAA